MTKDMYPDDLKELKELSEQPEVMCRGGSAIISPLRTNDGIRLFY
jgi:nitrilase